MEGNNKKMLEFSFDLNTLDHLGVKLYATIPPMIAELVSNAWDADSKIVNIFFNDNEEKEIIVEDYGCGMTFDELNNSFLKIGRNRRVETSLSRTPNNRPILGKKGLGKLSVFGIGTEITITSIKNGLKNEFVMNYTSIRNCTDGKYNPDITVFDQPTTESSGTKICIRQITRTEKFKPQNIVDDLSKRFTLFSEDFKVTIYHNKDTGIEVKNDTYFINNSQFHWDFPTDFIDFLEPPIQEFITLNGITGTLFTSQTPLPTSKRGIVLFARGKLVQEPTFFNERGNDNFFSYLYGYFNVDFIDEENEVDYCSTDRKSLAWDCDQEGKLSTLYDLIRICINKTQHIWRQKRADDKSNTIKDLGINVKEWIKDLNTAERPLATRLSNAIIQNEAIQPEEAKEYLSYVQDMFSYQTFKDFTQQLDELSILEDEKAIKLLTDWQLIEAKELAKIAEGRIRTINQFEKYIRENASETKVIQKFLEQFPWLLDPKMSSFEREVTYSNLLKQKFPDHALEGSNRRIDFLCSNNSGVVHIIELKRPNIKITLTEIQQALSYKTFFTNLYKNDVKEVHTILISNNPSMADDVELMYDALVTKGTLTIKSYDDLLAQAKRYHSEFINSYNIILEKKPDDN